jgi:hypothetical protein
LQPLDGDELLAMYKFCWDAYTLSTKIINHLLQYLNRHWVKRESDSKKEIYEISIVRVSASSHYLSSHVFLVINDHLEGHCVQNDFRPFDGGTFESHQQGS